MSKLITQRVRDLRKKQTPSENKLWQYLRNRKLAGYKSYRQHPLKVVHDGKVGYFIADFTVMKKI